MHKIFYIMGKSASGKDYLFRMLLERNTNRLQPYRIYTTRPMRQGEENGKEYFFVDEAEMRKMEESIIECRSYETMQGIWYYFTADNGQLYASEKDFLSIGTLESFQKLRAYYGERHVVPIYIETDDYIRLTRALEREKKQNRPDYAELCRRFLADAADFSEERLSEAGIHIRIENNGDKEALVQKAELLLNKL